MLQDTTNTAANQAANQPIQGLETGVAGAEQFGFDHMIGEMMAGEQNVAAFILIVLVIQSLAAWYYTIINWIRNAKIKARAEKVIATFWQTTNAQEAIRFMEEQPKDEPFSKIALDAAEAASHHQKHEGSRLVEALNRSEFIDRALRQAVTRESSKLENGLTLLATVGSTAPFVGLLGTVWKIYHALIGISISGSASIDAVAGPVGAALIMTAIGLAVAIPAVIAYNAFTRQNRVINTRFDSFAHDLHDFFATGSRVGDVAAAAKR